MDDDTDSAWDNVENTERRRREDEGLERAKKLHAELEQMMRESAERAERFRLATLESIRRFYEQR